MFNSYRTFCEQVLGEKVFPVKPQPFYALHLCAYDYFILPKMSSRLHDRCFESVGVVLLNCFQRLPISNLLQT